MSVHEREVPIRKALVSRRVEFKTRPPARIRHATRAIDPTGDAAADSAPDGAAPANPAADSNEVEISLPEGAVTALAGGGRFRTTLGDLVTQAHALLVLELPLDTIVELSLSDEGRLNLAIV